MKTISRAELLRVYDKIPRSIPYEVWERMHLKNIDAVVEPISSSDRPLEHPANRAIEERKRRSANAWAKMSSEERAAYLAQKNAAKEQEINDLRTEKA